MNILFSDETNCTMNKNVTYNIIKNYCSGILMLLIFRNTVHSLFIKIIIQFSLLFRFITVRSAPFLLFLLGWVRCLSHNNRIITVTIITTCRSSIQIKLTNEFLQLRAAVPAGRRPSCFKLRQIHASRSKSWHLFVKLIGILIRHCVNFWQILLVPLG